MARSSPVRPPTLRLVRTVHTIVWAVFAGSIFAIFPLAAADRFAPAYALIGLVLVEVVVLALNGMKCPLTGVAERFSDDRRPNFDIYLPQWLARYNKAIFGTLFVLAILFTLYRRLT